ncbi:MAG: glycosyltransferase family 87 protein [Bacteroidota bacterium]
MKLSDKTIAPIVLLITGIMLVLLHWFSTGVNGETDSITHYQLARYAFEYPANFLNHWGKPLFTILSAPLAQFGYDGAIVFNLICGLLSAWFAYLIAVRMEYRNAWVAIVFTVFTPVYLFIMYTSLTEILFSLVLISSIYLFVSKRFIGSAIIISVIPFARTEGMMFVVLFIPALLWMKQYKALPFLLTGFIIFSIAGWPLHHDLLWFFTKMPYSSSGSDLYGKGSFWYYFQELPFIMNYPLIILGITGLAFIILNLKKGFKNLHDVKYVSLYFLILPSFFGFILAQSFLWWQGMMGVLGSTRFIACVLPLTSIVALAGFNWVMEKAKPIKVLYTLLFVFVLSLVIYKPFTYGMVPMKTGINFAVMEKLTTWLKASPFQNRKAFYSDSMFPFYMDIDPLDQKKCFKYFNYENTDPATLLQNGELLIWDAQFAGYEGHLPFDSLMKNNNLRLLNIFTPAESFTIIGGAKYKLAVFMKAPRDTTKAVYKQFYVNDFESGLSQDLVKHTSTEYKSSGKQSIVLSPEFIYSPAKEGKLTNLPGLSNISLRASVRILIPSSAEKDNVLLVVGVDDENKKVYKYNVSKSSETKYKAGEWFELSFTDVVDRNTPVNGTYKTYVWYTGKNKVYVDDLKLEWMPVGFE